MLLIKRNVLAGSAVANGSTGLAAGSRLRRTRYDPVSGVTVSGFLAAMGAGNEPDLNGEVTAA